MSLFLILILGLIFSANNFDGWANVCNAIVISVLILNEIDRSKND